PAVADVVAGLGAEEALGERDAGLVGERRSHVEGTGLVGGETLEHVSPVVEEETVEIAGVARVVALADAGDLTELGDARAVGPGQGVRAVDVPVVGRPSLGVKADAL